MNDNIYPKPKLYYTESHHQHYFILCADSCDNYTKIQDIPTNAYLMSKSSIPMDIGKYDLRADKY